MQLFDLSLEELKKYNPEIYKPENFNLFWDSKIIESESQPLNIEIKNIQDSFDGIKTSEIYFDGFRNSRIHCNFIEPTNSVGETPVIVMFHGYNWNNIKITDVMKYTSMGYKILQMDLRGQSFKTPDHNKYPNGGPAGWMTNGMFNQDEYYYLLAYIDGVRAVEVATHLNGVDKTNVFTEGGSQGGGMTLAVAALSKRVKGAMADIPFLCHFRRSIEIGNGTPYEEFSHFFKIFDQEHKLEDEIHKVLSYFDNVNLASRISCPVMVTVGLCDNVCPPSTIFAAYNKIESEKQIFVFPDFGHGGFNEHDAHKINFIKRVRN